MKSEVVMSVIPQLPACRQLLGSLSDFLSLSSFTQLKKPPFSVQRSRHIRGPITSWKHAKQAHASKKTREGSSLFESVIFSWSMSLAVPKNGSKIQGTYQLALAPFDMHGHTSKQINHHLGVEPKIGVPQNG